MFFRRKKTLKDLDLTWFKESLENDEGDLDDDLDKIANELGTTRDKLDLEEIISILKIRENLSNQDKVKVAIGVQNALRKELKNLK
jgi:hypothetical protein|tara:strand:+ start:694 stop:951 length:258 start_codon:yes stop_codon:yes gene_type:complete